MTDDQCKIIHERAGKYGILLSFFIVMEIKRLPSLHLVS